MGDNSEEEDTFPRACANSSPSKGRRTILQRKKIDVRANTDQGRMKTGLDYYDKDETGLEAIELVQ